MTTDLQDQLPMNRHRVELSRLYPVPLLCVTCILLVLWLVVIGIVENARETLHNTSSTAVSATVAVKPSSVPATRSEPIAAPPVPIWEPTVPFWVLAGVLACETSSYYDPHDAIVWVNRRQNRRSSAAGAFQVTYAAFRQVARPGERWSDVRTDVYFCEDIAERYLLWLYRQHGSWNRAIRQYRGGLAAPEWTARYARRVAAVGTLYEQERRQRRADTK